MGSVKLQDRFGRSIDYVRLSVTDRCDLRCSYCMPKGFRGFEEPKDWLTFDEIERLLGIFVRLGTRRVRLTGGEPLLRRNLPELAQRLSALPGLQDLSLSTNATQLGKHAVALRAAGVDRINVSLDSLDRACMQQITGRDSLQPILDGLMAGKGAGFDPIKINMVAMRGVNDSQIEAMAAFCIEQQFILRLIEAMPMGSTGRNARYMPLGPVRERLAARFGLVPQAMELGGGPARYMATPDGRSSIGFITPMSQHFCATCNRVRLSVDGTLYLCLGQEEKFAFGPMLRGGATDAEIEAAIRAAIELKPQQHDFNTQPDKIIRFMAQTGG
ncbi:MULTISPECIES: GTP 3',8-cyclase MoaA [Janthinobacterium]|uniref:GTP 3',8-cyclase n=1 Tax=Janthinobacterium kumbetense TaxID=2950280 RepID=A0ABT0WM43_9BURK|nr:MULTISPECIES: GTP 3',8-cyclase MoaA [Janthinobacterium]MCM2565135.1 GTP 3',8-cyclase MoaA [Janthinobacterium kumbetense]MDN2676563.1 GTP 3',8-cyclase MoaA [Janthinobacterium sp. SUN033]MDN2700534.1 GTP 3',8-cyclase MoaA [Janthinobacterium sp. SUN100]MDO8047104.1 GTP 3',8-cyclase MoaA [Janthinobacterium sp. SUN211]MDO8064626.1 GTP 3',8-cyclase MoaA [Janthinobacterium sp. SUN206]